MSTSKATLQLLDNIRLVRSKNPKFPLYDIILAVYQDDFPESFTQSELASLCQKYKFNVLPNEVEVLFSLCTDGGVGTKDKLIDAILIPLSAQRKQQSVEAFNRLSAGLESVPYEDIIRFYRAENTMAVKSNKVSISEQKDLFNRTFCPPFVGVEIEGEVTISEFLFYQTIVSTTHKEDNYFSLELWGCWNLAAAGKARPTTARPRKVQAMELNTPTLLRPQSAYSVTPRRPTTHVTETPVTPRTAQVAPCPPPPQPIAESEQETLTSLLDEDVDQDEPNVLTTPQRQPLPQMTEVYPATPSYTDPPIEEVPQDQPQDQPTEDLLTPPEEPLPPQQVYRPMLAPDHLFCTRLVDTLRRRGPRGCFTFVSSLTRHSRLASVPSVPPGHLTMMQFERLMIESRMPFTSQELQAVFFSLRPKRTISEPIVSYIAISDLARLFRQNYIDTTSLQSAPRLQAIAFAWDSICRRYHSVNQKPLVDGPCNLHESVPVSHVRDSFVAHAHPLVKAGLIKDEQMTTLFLSFFSPSYLPPLTPLNPPSPAHHEFPVSFPQFLEFWSIWSVCEEDNRLFCSALLNCFRVGQFGQPSDVDMWKGLNTPQVSLFTFTGLSPSDIKWETIQEREERTKELDKRVRQAEANKVASLKPTPQPTSRTYKSTVFGSPMNPITTSSKSTIDTMKPYSATNIATIVNDSRERDGHFGGTMGSLAQDAQRGAGAGTRQAGIRDVHTPGGARRRGEEGVLGRTLPTAALSAAQPVLSDLAKRIKDSLMRMGPDSLPTLNRAFKSNESEPGFVSRHQFCQVMHNVFGNTLNNEDHLALFDHLERNDSHIFPFETDADAKAAGRVEFDSFVSDFTDPISDEREALVLKAFQIAGGDKDNAIHFRDVRICFQPDGDMQKRKVQRTKAEEIEIFLKNFNQMTETITFDEFLLYYTLLSTNVPDDTHFRLKMYSSWRPPRNRRF
ncbi:hypothetical protein BLNAU_5444 [Blattamonas nauphoetae]|uniref:Uncharacterized protein n=1 Tax=Blattamonas nauphoetae TaxID=2049346 RepID=A0ABQ9Y7C2_9EUKA|nr:hypothetical protein BLNAU_5444 [Blattamonas nauphoetae]